MSEVEIETLVTRVNEHICSDLTLDLNIWDNKN